MARLKVGSKVFANIERTYREEGDKIKVTVKSSFSKHEPQSVLLSKEQFWRYHSWLAGGGLIQVLLHDLPKDQREILISGIGQQEWDELFKKPEE